MPRNRASWQLRQASAFLVIGAIAFVVDAVTYNALVFWVTGDGPMRHLPIAAKVIAIVVASIVTYVGNRYWTFQARNLPHKWSRYALFVVFNLVAIGLQLGCLGFSRYVLGLDSLVADNVSGTIIGQILASLFRYITYDRYVFPHEDDRATESDPANDAVRPGDAPR